MPQSVEHSNVDYQSAPRDYEELYRTYYQYLVNLVRKNRGNIPECEVEDVANYIVEKFISRNMLAMFDPAAQFEFEGEMRPARFKTFLTKTVLAYLKGQRDRYGRRSAHEPYSLDAPVCGSSSAGGESSTTTWETLLDSMCPSPEDDVLNRLDYEEGRAAWRAYLATVPKRVRSDRCDLPALFDALVEQVEATGGWDIPALTQRFQVSGTAIHGWLWWLREQSACYHGVPIPPKRPRRTKAQMAAAREQEGAAA